MGIGGGIRGTKTFSCLSALILLCRIYPRSRWAVVRKDLPTLRRNVIPSMNKLIEMSGGFVGNLNMSDWTYTCTNGSQILLFPEQFIQDPELERWKGLEVNGFDLEEGSELNEKSANKAIERAGSHIIAPTSIDPNPRQPPPLVLVNFNPCPNWPRRWFYEPWKNKTIKEPYYFLPATIADNPYASEAYKESLKYLPEEEYKRFVMGEWDFVDDPNQLIKTEWIWDAQNVEPDESGPARMSVDAARYGDDFTKIVKSKGNHLRKLVTMKKFDVVLVANRVMNEANDPEFPVPGRNVRVDTVGLGAGVGDICRHNGLPIQEVIAGAKPIEREGSFFQFKDLRSQIWWEAREALRNKKWCFRLQDELGNEVPLPDKLIGDLASVRYEISGDRVIKVESKDDLKERLGRSTDDGDAVVTLMFDFPDLPAPPIFPGTVVVAGH